MYSKPLLNSEIISQILYGEKFEILSKNGSWFKIKTNFDNYIGYIKKNKYYQNFNPTNKIYKKKSKIFKKIHNKFLPTKNYLYFASGISKKKQSKEYIQFEKNKWIKKSDTKKINHYEKNFVKVLRLFLDSKYLWGGKTSAGMDCSALIQIYFYYNRIFFPRDTKDQIKFYKIKSKKKLFKHKLIFWKGHVAMCISKKELIHAYGPKKKVLIMNINKTVDKIFRTAKLKPLYI